MENDTADHKPGADPSGLNAIFDLPPARKIAGRSRPTQRITFLSEGAGGLCQCEGGNELTAALLLEQYFRWKLVKRFKLQPCTFSALGIDSQKIPDILVETALGNYVFIEVKSAKYLSKKVLDDYELLREHMRRRDLTLLLWNDEEELSRAVWHNVRHLQRASVLSFDEQELAALRTRVDTGYSLASLLSPTTSLDHFFCAVSKGLFFFDLTERPNESLVVTPYNRQPSCLILDRSESDVGDRWWDALSDREHRGDAVVPSARADARTEVDSD